MRIKSKLMALALTAALQPAFAAPAPVELNFDDLAASVGVDMGLVELGSRYAGALGVDFSGAAWGITNIACGGVVNFLAHSGCSALQVAADPRVGQPSPGKQGAVLNFADGFQSASLFYSARTSSEAPTVTVYEELDGQGKSVVFDGLIARDCTSGYFFCDWNALEMLDFGFVAKSIVFSGGDRSFLIDDLSLLPAADTPPPAELPEPASLALALGALGVAGWSRRRKAR